MSNTAAGAGHMAAQMQAALEVEQGGQEAPEQQAEESDSQSQKRRASVSDIAQRSSADIGSHIQCKCTYLSSLLLSSSSSSKLPRMQTQIQPCFGRQPGRAR